MVRLPTVIDQLRTIYSSRLQENVVMANYTTARVGGPADGLLIIHTSGEMEETVRQLWALNAPFYILGSGSNVLFSDLGFRGVVLINRAKTVKVDVHTAPPTVWAESGANLGAVARQVALRGLSGLEWAATIPGTVGGAVYGNAGAHGSDMAHQLVLAEILHRKKGRESWSAEQMAMEYRASALKRAPGDAVILAARLSLGFASGDEIQARMEEYSSRRRRTQPPGASLGSIFKNPPGEFAGRLIEAAGLKGTRSGGAVISNVHANFFLNDRKASAADIVKLIKLAQSAVFEKFGVKLELEVELVGEWQNNG
jgi:UDP-N-acetylmuramate dehydrogenase